jgi:large subunit ribosomal protein L5
MSDKPQTQAPPQSAPQAPPRLLAHYRQAVVPELMKRLGRDNPLAVPALSKIVLNMGVGKAKEDQKYMKEAQYVLKTISGQQPVVTRAKRSVAGFGLRAGATIGTKVTIRGRRMYEFLDRLMSVVMPRIRDFRGISADSFDGHGNYSLGIREHIVFPEIDPDATDGIYGLDITICTTAKTDPEALELLRLLGMPFRQ